MEFRLQTFSEATGLHALLSARAGHRVTLDLSAQSLLSVCPELDARASRDGETVTIDYIIALALGGALVGPVPGHEAEWQRALWADFIDPAVLGKAVGRAFNSHAFDRSTKYSFDALAAALRLARDVDLNESTPDSTASSIYYIRAASSLLPCGIRNADESDGAAVALKLQRLGGHLEQHLAPPHGYHGADTFLGGRFLGLRRWVRLGSRAGGLLRC
jgi:hypothetical protein